MNANDEAMDVDDIDEDEDGYVGEDNHVVNGDD